MIIKKENISFSTIYHNIWQVREASNILKNPAKIFSGQTKVLYVPQMFLKAFECELEMKYIILKNNGSVKTIHELNKLYKLLPEDVKKGCNKICESEEEFASFLLKYNLAFNDFRYESHFKGVSSFEPWFLNQLSDCLFEYIKNDIDK